MEPTSQPTFWQDIGETAIKGLGWFSGIILGMVGLMGRLLQDGRKMSRWKWVGVILISLFCGVMTRLTCDYYGWNGLGIFLTPLMTVFGEFFSLWFAQNYRRIFTGLFELILNRGKKD